MNKADIATNVMAEAEKLGYKLKKSHAESLVAVAFTSVSQALVKGERVALSELGVFTPKQYPPAKRRSPQTGATIDVPARTKAKFREGKLLKEALAGVPIAPTPAPAAA